LSGRALIFAGADDDGVFLQARDGARAAADAAGAVIELAAAPPYRSTGTRGRRALTEEMNAAIMRVDAPAIVLSSPRVRLSADSLECLFAAVEAEPVIAVPLIADTEGRVQSGGELLLPDFGRWWNVPFLEGERVDDLPLPEQFEITFPPPEAFAFRRAETLHLGGFDVLVDPNIDVVDLVDFTERHRAAGGKVVLLPGAVAVLEDVGEPVRLEEFRDVRDFGNPERRTLVNTEVFKRGGIVAELREPQVRVRTLGPPAPLVFGRIGPLGADGEELRSLAVGLEQAGREPSTDFGPGGVSVRVGPAARALLKSADRRWRPGGGEIWLTERDCWMAVAGEPALLRLPEARPPGPALRRALRDRQAFAVTPSSAVADALIAEGLEFERTLVLPPYLGALDLAPDDPDAEPVDLHAFLQVRDRPALRAALQAIRATAPNARVTLTWPMPDERALVDEALPDARLDERSLWASAGPDASASVVLLLDGWDRYARRLRSALQRGAAVVAQRRYEALLDPAERERCQFVDPSDPAQLRAALQAARDAGRTDPAPLAEAGWRERVEEVVEEARRRGAAGARPPRSALIATPWLPSDRESAGHLRLREIVDGFQRLGTEVTLVGAHERWRSPRVFDCLRQGALALAAYDLGLDVRGRLARRRYDLVYAHFHEMAAWIKPALLEEAGEVPVAVDSVDLHYLRRLREAELRGGRRATRAAVDEGIAELLEYATADVVVVATEEDERRLAGDLGPRPTVVLSTIHRPREHVPPAHGRRGVLFVGSYAHPPNVDAVQWLMRDIAPRLRDRGCDDPILVAGSRMPAKLARLVHRRGGEALGFVPDLDPVYNAARCMVAPLRFGAGMKGKIGESLAAGLPVITTSIGAEGFPPNPGLVIGEDADAIADGIVSLVADDALWQRASEGGREVIAEALGPARAEVALRELLAAVGLEAPALRS
jgi:glycosyltransferase involved in cell wall biosynthesis